MACGVAAFIPLGILGLAAHLGWARAALGVTDSTGLIIGAWAAGLVEAAARLHLPIPIRMALSAIAGSAVFEAAAGDVLPWIGLALGAPLGAITAWATGRLADGAVAGDGTRNGVGALMAGAAVVLAAVAIIPFAGFVLIIAAAWLALRSYRADRERFAGLRVLK